jgi:hypothetical protein
MKIAICYSGMFRNFQNNVDSHIKHLISKYDCDIYLSFWDVYGFGSFRDKLNIKHDDIIPEHVKGEILNKLHPKNFEFESYDEMDIFFEFEGNKYRDTKEPPPYCKNILSMYYKIKRCGKMVEDSGINYDLILRLRGDILFTEDLILQSPKENTIYSPLIFSWTQSMNDQLIYGNKKVMGIYHGLYDKLPEIWLSWSTHVSPESLLYRHMENNNISMESLNFFYDLLDENGNKK